MTALDCWFIALVPVALLVLVVWACCDTASHVTERERDRSCVCGHAFRVHEHYREGTDCGFVDGCTRFRAADVARVRDADLPFNVSEWVDRDNDFIDWEREVAS